MKIKKDSLWDEFGVFFVGLFFIIGVANSTVFVCVHSDNLSKTYRGIKNMENDVTFLKYKVDSLQDYTISNIRELKTDLYEYSIPNYWILQ